MNKVVLALSLLASITCYANEPEDDIHAFTLRVQQLEQKIEQLSSDVHATQNSTASLKHEVSSVNDKISALEMKSDSIDNNLMNKIQSNINLTNSNHDAASKQIQEVGTESKSEIHKLSVWGSLATIALLIIACAIYFILRRGIAKSSDAITAIRKAQNNLQEESVKLDTRLVDILDKQLNIDKIQNNASAGIDHSLALKVADEITRIEVNLARMDSSVKGYKQLTKAVDRIKNNFQANGYDIVTYMGQTYNEGMRINADFVVDEELPDGTRTITSVSKPQVHYKGELIQKATVTVTQNI